MPAIHLGMSGTTLGRPPAEMKTVRTRPALCELPTLYRDDAKTTHCMLRNRLPEKGRNNFGKLWARETVPPTKRPESLIVLI